MKKDCSMNRYPKDFKSFYSVTPTIGETHQDQTEHTLYHVLKKTKQQQQKTNKTKRCM